MTTEADENVPAVCDDNFSKFELSVTKSRIEHVADVKGSIFNLIAATLGAGTISFPYAIMENGIFFGSLLIAFAALLSYDSGMMLIRCSKVTG